MISAVSVEQTQSPVAAAFGKLRRCTYILHDTSVCMTHHDVPAAGGAPDAEANLLQVALNVEDGEAVCTHERQDGFGGGLQTTRAASFITM